jgi:stage II sporulation protein D
MLKFILKKKLASSLIFIFCFFVSGENEIYIKILDGHNVKEIELEEYVAGVVSKEMGEKFPLEALKAQAVVSRTYLIWKKLKNNGNYDIKNSIYHQVYGECKSEKIKSSVIQTKREVLITPDEKIIPVFFHACCGGKTTNPSDVWKGNYLFESSVIDTYCENSTYSLWEKKFSKKYLSEVFGIQVEKIVINERDKTGRVKNLQIISKDGKIKNLNGNEFRIKLNENTEIFFNNPYVLPSTLFDIFEDGEKLIFKGKGYGHGVGLCQYGAKKMAEMGFNYVEILKFYFPNLQLGKLKND